MRVLVVGSGAREHALCWKIRQSPLVRELWCAPGNAGIAREARCAPDLAATDVEGLARFVADRRIDLTVVGPEGPLAAGIVDRLEREGRLALGPTAPAARVETSKAFAKELMKRAGIPTAAHATFDEPGAAYRYLEERGAPVVVKADGLAAGKGVSLCRTVEQARLAVRQALEDGAFGDAGRRVVIEELLSGVEASYIVLTDGRRSIPLATAKDHKAIFDGDRGPNTGGMGVVSPAPALGEAEIALADRAVIGPALRELAGLGHPFRGFLYAGLMLGRDGLRVLEFNARLGDPEAQGILVRLRSDLVPALVAAAQGDLGGVSLEWDERPSVTVVLASAGYPGKARTGVPIAGIEEAEALPGVLVFHAGTRLEGETVVTAGGRVLAVTALGPTVGAAADAAYEAARRIRFDGMQYRRDIGRAAGPTAT